MDPTDPSKNQQPSKSSWMGSWAGWKPSNGTTPANPPSSTNSNNGSSVNLDTFFQSLFAMPAPTPATSGGGGGSLFQTPASSNLAPPGISQPVGGVSNRNPAINYNDLSVTVNNRNVATKPNTGPIVLPSGNARIDAVIDMVARGLGSTTPSAAGISTLATPVAAATAISSVPIALPPAPAGTYKTVKSKATKRAAPATTSNPMLPSYAALNLSVNNPPLPSYSAAGPSSATPTTAATKPKRGKKAAKWKNPNASVTTSANVQVLPPPLVFAEPSMPPDWQTYCDQTYASLSTHQTFPVDPTSQEYLTITELLSPTNVISVEKIVNPDLWQRYVNTRKDMLKAKTDDFSLLSKLGCDDKEVSRSINLSINFTKDPLLCTESARYSPNETLLFHCTRNKDNLDKILSQGLDERLSSITGGLLGKGIYFADDPQKSIQYDGGTGIILIFAVLLGDCMSVDHLPNKNSFVREPEKETKQRRNFNDQFFDSITARPSGKNEYVIYNRFQCCPIYQIKYGWNQTAPAAPIELSLARQGIPTVAWRNSTPGSKSPMPNQALDGAWPFFAPSIFEKMGVLPPLNNDDDQFEPYTIDSNGIIVAKGDDEDTKEKLETLANLGFFDEEKNKEALLKYGNNLEQAVNSLLDDMTQTEPQPQPPQVSTSSVLTGNKIIAPASIATIDLSSDSETDSEENIKRAKLATAELPEDLANWALEFDSDSSLPPVSSSPVVPVAPAQKEECSICCNEYDAFSTASYLWKELPCSHRLCFSCYQSIQNSGKTMSGVYHVSVKCPFCQGITGTEVGTCPDGKMNVNILPSACVGYPGKKTIQINYAINSGHYHLNRTAYLPDTPEGNEVLQLLRTAWDRRLCFTIGNSNTTGAQNVLVWNIHHKTAMNGGVEDHGYPDETYLERVKWELKAYGIE